MINPLHSITSYAGKEAEFQDYLESIELDEIFGDLIGDEYVGSYASSVAKYIVWGYGMDSGMLPTDGYTWGKLSQQIFIKAKLPEALFGAVIELNNDAVIDAIQNFINYQNDENWTQYCAYRDLRTQMLKSSVKTGPDTNWEQKMKNAIHSQTLLGMMNNAKETFIQNHVKLKGSVEAFNRVVQSKEKVTRSPAHYAQS